MLQIIILFRRATDNKYDDSIKYGELYRVPGEERRDSDLFPTADQNKHLEFRHLRLGHVDARELVEYLHFGISACESVDKGH